MSITSLLNAQATSPMDAQGTTEAKAGDDLGKEEFLKLLIAQLNMQDPLSPVSNEQFVAQLAQFSSVEQLVSVNERLDTLAVSQASQISASAINFIGKDVRAMGDWVEFSGDADSSVEIPYELMGDAESIEINITDESGNVVRTETLTAQDKGSQSFSWDGKDNNKNLAKEGTYTVKVSAKDADDNVVQSFPVTEGKISGISYDKGYPELMIGDHKVALSDIIKILED